MAPKMVWLLPTFCVAVHFSFSMIRTNRLVCIDKRKISVCAALALSAMFNRNKYLIPVVWI